jgi:transposase
MLDALPTANALLGDRGYDASWFREALIARGITPCIPSRQDRKVIIDHDKGLYRERHKIENMFGRRKAGDVFTPATTDAREPSSLPMQMADRKA